MQLKGLTSKLLNNADKLGMLAAVLGNQPNFSAGSGLNAIISSVQQLAAGVVHTPDFAQVQSWVQNEGKTALLGWIGAEALGMVGISQLSRLSKPVQDGLLYYAAASLGIRLFYSATHSELKGENIEKGAASFIAQASPYHY